MRKSIFLIISINSFSSSYNAWWQAKNLRTKQVGYVPVNYTPAINDLTAYE
jgi:hypothetical protein